MAKKKRGNKSKKGEAADVAESNEMDEVSSQTSFPSMRSVNSYTDLVSFGIDADEGYGEDDSGAEMCEAGSSAMGEGLMNPQILGDLVDKITEKRRDTRCKGLTELTSMLLRGSPEQIEDFRETVLTNVLQNIRSGDAKTVPLACRALAVLCILIGPEEEELYQRIENPLRTIVTRHSHAEGRKAALRCLAIACFICSSQDADTHDLLDFCQRVFQRRSPGVMVTDEVIPAALSCWGLLATTLTTEFVHQTAGPRVLRTLLAFLEHGDMSVRMAAGENAALIHECKMKKVHELEALAEEKQLDEAEAEELIHQADDEQGIAEVWDEIIARMEDLRGESSKRISKKNRKEVRATFREIYASIVEDDNPSEQLQVVGGTIRLNTWAHIVQVDALRNTMRGGFQIQLQVNPILREILGECFQNDGVSMVDRRANYAKSSDWQKYKTTERTKQRKARQNQRDVFLDSDW